jgi:hypothetical protein
MRRGLLRVPELPRLTQLSALETWFLFRQWLICILAQFLRG